MSINYVNELHPFEAALARFGTRAIAHFKAATVVGKGQRKKLLPVLMAT